MSFKVALLGEFSSLHKYLKEGLLELGGDIEVTLYANGDGWKKIKGADAPLYLHNQNKFRNLFGVIQSADTVRSFDVVQIMHPHLYSCFANPHCIRSLAAHNGMLSMISAGTDLANMQAYRSGVFDYYVHDYCNVGKQTYETKSLRCLFNRLADRTAYRCADIVIPICYEYAVGYAGRPKAHSVIPFPLNVDAIPYREN
ncbi:MAG: hypothetical protein IJ236_05955, partial [Oscillospiraceae bacterium]|nr:hypothetical protein [Oscillospiraceae bacterium]